MQCHVQNRIAALHFITDFTGCLNIAMLQYEFGWAATEACFIAAQGNF